MFASCCVERTIPFFLLKGNGRTPRPAPRVARPACHSVRNGCSGTQSRMLESARAGSVAGISNPRRQLSDSTRCDSAGKLMPTSLTVVAQAVDATNPSNLPTPLSSPHAAVGWPAVGLVGDLLARLPHGQIFGPAQSARDSLGRHGESIREEGG